MNNWRLLLLALVAVFEPIFSFTDNNPVDGRQQCCDRQRDTLFRDSRPYLYENNRYAKTVSPIRRVNSRDELRADRQLSPRATEVSRRSTERSSRDKTERNFIRNPSILARFSREEHRTFTSDDNRDRQLVGLRRERNTLTRISDAQRTVRVNNFAVRYSESRDNRVHRLSNERQDRDTFSQDRVEIRSENSRRDMLTRDTRDNLQMKREDVGRVVMSHDRRQLGIRERVNVIRREQRSRDDVRRYMNNNEERRERENSPTQRRSLSENSGVLERLREMKIRVNSINQRQGSQIRLSENVQLHYDRRQSRETIRENAKIRVLGDRAKSRETRESRFIDDRSARDQRRDNRRESRLNERFHKETRDDELARVESRLTRKATERDNRVNDLRTRSRDLESSRSSRLVSNSNRYDSVRNSDGTRRQIALHNTITNRERSIIDDRFRNVDSVRARENSNLTSNVESSEAIGNWQYILYSVQAAYLCALMMEMLTPNRNGKIEMRNQRWWPLLPQRSIKVD